jgi:hypothetical protein
MTVPTNRSIPPLPCYLGSGLQGQFTTVDKATVSVLVTKASHEAHHS